MRASSTLGRFWARYQEKVSCWDWRWASRASLHGGLIGAVGQLGQHHDVRGGVHGGEADGLLKGVLGQLEEGRHLCVVAPHAEGHAAVLADLIGGLHHGVVVGGGDVDAVDIQFGVPVYRVALQHGQNARLYKGDAVRHLGGGFHLLVVQPNTVVGELDGDAVVPEGEPALVVLPHPSRRSRGRPRPAGAGGAAPPRRRRGCR